MRWNGRTCPTVAAPGCVLDKGGGAHELRDYRSVAQRDGVSCSGRCRAGAVRDGGARRRQGSEGTGKPRKERTDD